MKCTYRNTFALVISAALMGACSPPEQATVADTADTAQVAVDQEALKGKAVGAIKALGGNLKGELQTAMKAGGPIQALDVCNTQAPDIAAKVTAEQGMTVSRTSLKVRNPNNAATEWQTAVLNDFESRKTAGEDPAKLAYSAVVGDEYRFMKAIPTAAVCTNCHGAELKPSVEAKILELYPDDKATGFKEGDLRGAFVVTASVLTNAQ